MDQINISPAEQKSASVNVWNVRAQHLNVLMYTLVCTPTFRNVNYVILLRPIGSFEGKHGFKMKCWRVFVFRYGSPDNRPPQSCQDPPG